MSATATAKTSAKAVRAPSSVTIAIESIAKIAGADWFIPITARIENLPANLTPDQTQVTWTPVSGSPSFTDNNYPVVGPGYKGHYYNTVYTQASVGTAKIKAILYDISDPGNPNNLAESAPHSITFQRLMETEAVFSNKNFAPAGGVIDDEANRVRLWTYVYENTAAGVEGVEVQWPVDPNITDLDNVQFYKSLGDNTVAPPIPPERADMVGGVPATLTDSTGMAELYICSKTSQYLTFTCQVLGSTKQPQQDAIFATWSTPLGPGYNAPTIESSMDGQNLVFQDGDFSFTVNVNPSNHPLDSSRVFLVISNVVNGIDTPIDTPWSSLWGSADGTLHPVPYADVVKGDQTNTIGYFVQDLGGTTKMSGTSTFGAVGEYNNIPDRDSRLERHLQEASVIPYPGSNGFITQDLLEVNDGLLVRIPKVPADYDGGALTVYFFLNGYDHGTYNVKTRLYMDTSKTASKSAPTDVKLDSSFAGGFSVNPGGGTLKFYCDYHVQRSTNNTNVPEVNWSTYPHGFPMNT